MKYQMLIVLLTFGVLAGCSEQLNGWQIQRAIEICKANGGVDYIIVQEAREELLMCMNGAGYTIKKSIN